MIDFDVDNLLSKVTSTELLGDALRDLNALWNKSLAQEKGLLQIASANTNNRLNVIIFGDSGACKSSLVNLIAGKKVAKASASAVGCTTRNTPYEIDLPDGTALRVWDTAGLNEASHGTVTPKDAIKNIFTLARDLKDGVSLLILCTRGRILGETPKNYNMFKAFCDDKVPIALVVTGLEDEDDKVKWWKENKSSYKREGMQIKHHACITTLPQHPDRDQYAEAVRTMIKGALLPQPWRMSEQNWFWNCVGKLLSILFGVETETGKLFKQGLEKKGMSSRNLSIFGAFGGMMRSKK